MILCHDLSPWVDDRVELLWNYCSTGTALLAMWCRQHHYIVFMYDAMQCM